MHRRHFLQKSAAAVAAAALPFSSIQAAAVREPRYQLALGQWTFNRAFRGVEGVARRDALEFPTMAGELGFGGVDYSGILLGEHHANPKSLTELNRRASDAGVKNVLILIDLHDALGAKDVAVRQENVEKYKPWLEAAATLGCIGVRVNPISDGSLPADEQAKLLADGLTRLLKFSVPMKLDVMIENHGEGLQTDGAWLASVAKLVDDSHCGTLPDFGNFQKNRATGEYHDRYAGVAAMLPFAKCVCAKSLDFDVNGDECYSDYARLLKQVADSGYRGWIEVEYEGPGHAGGPKAERTPEKPLSETEGCLATEQLLEKVLGAELATKP
ncbi:MAG: sugar phosphate isomerase/epimerase family protein [Planctomycetaceae bacterium]